MVKNKNPRILFADADTRLTRQLSKFFNSRGFECHIAQDASNAIGALKSWRPDFVIYDMMLPGLTAMGLLKQISSKKLNLDYPTEIMVISNHNAPENVNACIHAGAADFIKKPATSEDILARIAFHMQKKQDTSDKKVDEKDLKKRGEYYLYLTELFLKKAIQSDLDTHETMFDLINMQAMTLKAVRCSLIQTNAKDLRGTVLRSSDDRDFSGFGIPLQKYPEVITVLHTQKMVAIDDLGGSQVMSKVKKDFKSIAFNSMVVCPVFIGSQIFGVISTRRQEEALPLTDSDLRFCQVMAHVCGLILSAENPYAAQVAA